MSAPMDRDHVIVRVAPGRWEVYDGAEKTVTKDAPAYFAGSFDACVDAIDEVADELDA